MSQSQVNADASTTPSPELQNLPAAKPYPFNKPFSFSYSKLKNYDTCPQKHYAVDLVKKFKEPDNPQLVEGSQIHEAFAKHLTDGTPLPLDLSYLQGWMDKIKAMPDKKLVEQKMAITATFD